MKIKNIVITLGLFVFIMSCGSKKGIVTKKSQVDKKEMTRPKDEDKSGSKKTETSDESKPKVSLEGMSSTEVYIYQLSDVAKDEMRKYGIPASITMAQGILESGSGKGRLSVEANNHFGIKCHDWNGAKIYHDDDAKQECFRKYNNVKYSYRDHSLFLTTRDRYMGLFQLAKDDYKGWAKGLKKAGYATDRKYPQKLISLIERYELYDLDAEVLGKDMTRVSKKAGVTNKHTVVKGDTLYSLSRRYKVTIQTLQELNGLDSTQLYVGQVLYVKSISKDHK